MHYSKRSFSDAVGAAAVAPIKPMGVLLQKIFSLLPMAGTIKLYLSEMLPV
jgi:hypothetical protein